jgi:hypothetical protein
LDTDEGFVVTEDVVSADAENESTSSDCDLSDCDVEEREARDGRPISIKRVLLSWSFRPNFAKRL